MNVHVLAERPKGWNFPLPDVVELADGTNPLVTLDVDDDGVPRAWWVGDDGLVRVHYDGQRWLAE